MSIGFAKLHPCNNQGYYNYIDIYLPIFIPLSRRKTWRNYVRIAAHVFLRVAVTEYACAKPIVCSGIGQRHNGKSGTTRAKRQVYVFLPYRSRRKAHGKSTTLGTRTKRQRHFRLGQSGCVFLPYASAILQKI